jgi:hypothetical protein
LNIKEKHSDLTFKKCFEKWRESSILPASPSASRIIVDGFGKEQEDVEEFEKIRLACRKDHSHPNTLKPIPEFYTKHAVWTSIAEQLLDAIDEGLVEELFCVSSERKTKTDDELEPLLNVPRIPQIKEKRIRMNSTFGSFPITTCQITRTERIGEHDHIKEFHPQRWRVLKEDFPDFDIFIDDNPHLMEEVVKKFENEKEKIYVLPDYRTCRGVIGDNIYHVETTVSDMTDERFEEVERKLYKKTSLYNLIKRRYKKKGRPIKIVSDWDETIQPLKPMAVFEYLDKEAKEAKSFKDFFQFFWENATVEGSPSKPNEGIHFSGKGGKKVKEAFLKYEKMRKTKHDSAEKFAESFYGSQRRWETPLTTIGEDLVKALEDGFISEFLIISSFRNWKGRYNDVESKKRKIENTFGHFPQFRLELTELTKPEKSEDKSNRAGKFRRRWQVISKVMPDFDIFVDDHWRILKECIDNIPDIKDKWLVNPDYKVNRDKIVADNYFHVPSKISKIKDGEITEVARKVREGSFSLYEIIKRKYQIKGKPLKIASDYDDCLQPLKPLMIYLSCNMNTPYNDFAKKYWESTLPNGQVDDSSLTKDEKKAIQEFENRKKKDREERKKNPDALFWEKQFADVPLESFYDRGCFNKIAEDLLKSIEEGMVDKLFIITSLLNHSDYKNPKTRAYDFLKNKEKKVEKTFGRFPCLEKYRVTPLNRTLDGGFTPYRWNILLNEFPDFDIFIDDNSETVKELLKNLDKFPDWRDKEIVLPNYKSCRTFLKPNVYYCNNSASKIKDEDFARVAEKLKAKNKNNTMSDNNDNKDNKNSQEKPKWYDFKSTTGKILWIGVPVLLLIGGGLIYWFMKKKKDKKDEAEKETL